MTSIEQLRPLIIREQRHPAAWWLTAVLGACSIGLIDHIVYTVCAIVLAIMAVRAYAYSPQALKNFRIIALATSVFMALRVVLQNLFGFPMGTTVLVHVPSVALPEWLSGVRLGGPLTLESVVFALNDGARIAGITLLFAMAAAITSPTRVLRALPLTLHSTGMLLVIAVTFLPHLLTDISRLRHASRWRGQRSTGIRAVVAQVINLAESALDRSVTLAASLTARGYSHSHTPQKVRSILLLGALGLVGFTTGLMLFGLRPVTVLGALLSLLLMWHGLSTINDMVTRTRYRQEKWTPADFGLVVTPIGPVVINSLSGTWGYAYASMLLLFTALIKFIVVQTQVPAVGQS